MATIIALPIGQGLELQDSKSEAEPGHVFPPLAGEGLSQILVLLLLPPPQDLEQLVQVPH